MCRIVLCCLLGVLVCTLHAEALPPIPRKLPPVGKMLADKIAKPLQQTQTKLAQQLTALADKPLYADVAIFHKAVDFAFRFHEIYDEKKDVPKITWCQKQAQERIASFDKAPWCSQRGLVVRGFISAIDDSPQPYGLVIPDKLDLKKPSPLYVWLHGRGDKVTDLHFIYGCARSAGQIKPATGIVLHVFGRQCVGYKNAGETDVFEAIAHVKSQYKIDENRIALMGFSMGGAGTKHIGAHFADQFTVMHTGAGFAETARYQHLTAADVPANEAILWGQYDTPDYVRNLFNIPVIAYSGEEDKQMAAGIILGEAYAAHGKELPHLIAPKTGHKYHPDYLKQVMQFVDKAMSTGRDPHPNQVYLQTKTLRYPSMYWVEALALSKHWQDSRIDAQVADNAFTATTTNITRLRFTHPQIKNGMMVTLDGTKLTIENIGADGAIFAKDGSTWKQTNTLYPAGLSKRPGLQGPIDDAFVRPFLMVLPSKSCADPVVERWVQAESKHQIERWAALMRGDARVKKDTEVTQDDIAQYNLVLWGDVGANSVLAQIIDKLPVRWSADSIAIGTATAPSKNHVPACIYPNPLNTERYIVVNSGITFREAHDRTNSQQNPKLGDWAIIDLSEPPSDSAPGKVVSSGFFNEMWR